MNQEDLNRILKSRIFLHKDGQLWATHIVLGYTPISFSFQSPTKDPQLVQINVATLGFLASPSLPPLPPPPGKGTHNVALIDHQVAKILQAEKEVIPLEEEREETTLELVSTIPKEDFNVFNWLELAESSTTSSRP